MVQNPVMTEIELIGVPFDGYGRPDNPARASTVLREAGLPGALGRHTMRGAGDLDLPAGTPERAGTPRWSTSRRCWP